MQFEAFQTQSDKCSKVAGSCLQNQIRDLLYSDLKLKMAGKTPNYLVSGKGNFDPIFQSDNNIQLQMSYEDVFTTQITLEIQAKNIKILTNLGRAEIVSLKAESFEAQSSIGKLSCSVQNISIIVSQFEVSVTCSEFIQRIPSKLISLNSQETANLEFDLTSTSKEANDNFCLVSVSNMKGEEVAK